MRDTGPGPSGIDAESPPAEQYFHVDAYRNNRFGEAVGTRVDRMTRYPMIESECRAMVRSLNRSCPPGITYLLTKVRDDE